MHEWLSPVLLLLFACSPKPHTAPLDVPVDRMDARASSDADPDSGPSGAGDGALDGGAEPADSAPDAPDHPELIGADALVEDAQLADAMIACGDSSQPCCAGDLCTTGLACLAGSCAAAISPFSCPMGAPGAIFVSETPPPAEVRPFERFRTSVTHANCSGATWVATNPSAPDGHKLGFDAPRDDDLFGASRIGLPADVPSGSMVTIPILLRAPALTGPHEYAFDIVHEGTAWLGAPSPTHVLEVVAVSRLELICPGEVADLGGNESSSEALQRCVDATPSGGILAIPAGTYRITTELRFTHPLTLTTAGAVGLPGCMDTNGPECAVLRADEALDVPRGFVRFEATSDVTLDHVVLDGNRGARLGSAAASACAAGTNGSGFNAGTSGCLRCSFLFGGSARALCGTGWEWHGDEATVQGSEFRGNGEHHVQSMWADGLTLLQSNRAVVTGNRFRDNSDVDLIFGGGVDAIVSGNVIDHRRQPSFAGLMLDNFNGVTSGDFSGTVVSGNVVQCGAELCDYAIELGPHPWYPSPNLVGGAVQSNVALGGKFNINAEGAGTALSPMLVTGNTIGPAPSSARLLCGERPTTAFNVSPDSFVDVGAGPEPTGRMEVHDCP